MGAFGAVTVAEWALGTAVAIAAFSRSGSLAVGLVGFRFVVAALAGLWVPRLGGGRPRERILTATASARALVAGAAVLALALGAPFAAVVAFVWLDAAVGSAYRPAQAALLPSVVSTPAELTRAATLCSNAKTVAQVLGALLGGVVLAASSVEVGVALAGALYVISAILTARIGPTAPVRQSSATAAMAGGLAAVRHSADATRIAAWTSMRALLRGAWTALGVIAALGVLDMGESGYGVLMVAAGAGAIAAVPVTHALIGRRHLVGPLAVALALCGIALAAIGATALAGAAIALMVVWGLGMAVSDASAQALLNRVIGVGALAAAVAAIESAKLLAEGLGALLAPALVGLAGVRGALVIAGAAAVAAVAFDLPGLRRMDRSATGRVRVLELVRRVPLFEPLRLDGLEAVTARVRAERAHAGDEVVRQDEPGRRWYLVVDGTLEVTVDGHVVNTLAPGASFGERALLREDVRSATVRAVGDVDLLSLGRADFLAAVLGDGVVTPAVLAPPRTALDALARQPLLHGAAHDALEALARAASTASVAAGEQVIREGELDDRWLVILDGEVVVERDGRPPRALGPGDALGEIAVLHRIPRTATAVATTAAEVLEIPGDALRAALGHDGAAAGAGRA